MVRSHTESVSVEWEKRSMKLRLVANRLARFVRNLVSRCRGVGSLECSEEKGGYCVIESFHVDTGGFKR